METNKILDNLLGKILQKRNERYKEPLLVDALLREFNLFNHEEFKQLLDIMASNGYVYLPKGTGRTDLDPYKDAMITVKGIKFYEAGGYVQKEIDKKVKLDFAKTKDRVLYIGAIVGGVFAVIQILKLLFQFFLFYF